MLHRPLLVGRRADPRASRSASTAAATWHAARACAAPNAPRSRGCAGTIAGARRGAGGYALLARATDGAGRTQPDAVPFNDDGYQFWAVVRHPVTVA